MARNEWTSSCNPIQLLTFQGVSSTPRQLRLLLLAIDSKTFYADGSVYAATGIIEKYADGRAGEQDRRQAEHILLGALYRYEPLGYEQAILGLTMRCTAAQIEIRPTNLFDPLAKFYNHLLVCNLIRDIFSPTIPHLNPAILQYSNGLVPRLAHTIYNEKRFDEIGVVADALEDAGHEDICQTCKGTGWLPMGMVVRQMMYKECDNCKRTGIDPNGLLVHLRAPLEHVRGCYALDLLRS